MMRRKSLFVVLVLALAVALASGALAQLVPNGRLGPIATYPTYVDPVDGTTKPGNGFPIYVEDINGVRLDLPVPPVAPMIFDPPISGNAFSEAIGFGAEAFFYMAQSAIDPLPTGGKALLTLAVEAAFGAEDPVDGDQFLFNRVRIRIDTPVTGTYTVFHPWGSKTFEVADAGEGINFTFDYGGFAPLCPNQPPCLTDAAGQPLAPAGFERFLVSPTQWVFLTQVTPPSTIAGFIGDGNPATVTGSTITHSTLGPQNFFRVEGPAGSNLGGGGVDFVQTEQFTVTGHFYGGDLPEPPPPPEVDVVTITRARLRGNAVEVRATSSNGFAMSAEVFANGVGGTLLGSGNLGTSGRGNISFTGGTPDTVRVHSLSNNPAIAPGAAIAPIQ